MGKMLRAVELPTLSIAQGAEGRLLPAAHRTLWAGSAGGGSTSWKTSRAEHAVLLLPSCRWRQAGKEPAPKPRAPLLRWERKSQKAMCFWKMRKEPSRQVLLFSTYCKILTWLLVRDIFCKYKTWWQIGFQYLYPLTNWKFELHPLFQNQVCNPIS